MKTFVLNCAMKEPYLLRFCLMDNMRPSVLAPSVNVPRARLGRSLRARSHAVSLFKILATIAILHRAIKRQRQYVFGEWVPKVWPYWGR